MKAACIKSFVDNGVLVNIGDSVNFSEARVRALEANGYLKAEIETAEETPKKKRTKRGD